MDFKFRDGLRLKIEGVEYEIDPFAPSVNAASLKFAEAITKMNIEQIFGATSQESYDDVKKIVADMLDAVLGNGAYKKIQAGRAIGIMDHMDVAMQIARAITAFRTKRIEQFIGDIPIEEIQETEPQASIEPEHITGSEVTPESHVLEHIAKDMLQVEASPR